MRDTYLAHVNANYGCSRGPGTFVAAGLTSAAGLTGCGVPTGDGVGLLVLDALFRFLVLFFIASSFAASCFANH